MLRWPVSHLLFAWPLGYIYYHVIAVPFPLINVVSALSFYSCFLTGEVLNNNVRDGSATKTAFAFYLDAEHVITWVQYFC